MLFGLLEFLWHTLPEKTVAVWLPEYLHWVWIPLVGFTMSILTGLSVVIMGEPGDLAYTIKCVHDKAYISMDHVMPMAVASQFSILGGGSLGPEAPLVAICAALGGFLSRRMFGQRNRNVVRKHTLMGMAGALSAFFGCPLGGSLFALEVNSRFGVEYFEHMVESIFCGEICLVVFRSLSGLPIGPIWTITPEKLTGAEPKDVLIGAALGLLGAFVAYLFTKFHGTVMFFMASFDLLDNKFAIRRALIGGVVIVTLGLLIPQTMFWGESEFGSISSLSPASTLENIWPTTGLLGFELTSAKSAFLMGFAKMVAISFTVAGGYRGGFIFPFFAAGAAFGRCLCFLISGLNIQVACLCMAAGINVAITRTSLATSLILCYLAGEPNAISAVLASSLVSLFATTYMVRMRSIRSID
jgi:H+/Cl- antiporter ClcA